MADLTGAVNDLSRRCGPVANGLEGLTLLSFTVHKAVEYFMIARDPI
jgi:hypothetical protein